MARFKILSMKFKKFFVSGTLLGLLSNEGYSWKWPKFSVQWSKKFRVSEKIDVHPQNFQGEITQLKIIYAKKTSSVTEIVNLFNFVEGSYNLKLLSLLTPKKTDLVLKILRIKAHLKIINGKFHSWKSNFFFWKF